MAAATRHETRALLRAHLAAAQGRTGYRHLTRHCPVCHRLLRLAMEPCGGRRGGATRMTRQPVARRPPGGRLGFGKGRAV